MPRSHRPYRPKIRGCFECSKRRIHCDRGEPACGKCISKGLACSGLGIRYRFNDGVAARGRWKGQVYQDTCQGIPQQDKTRKYPDLQFRHFRQPPSRLPPTELRAVSSSRESRRDVVPRSGQERGRRPADDDDTQIPQSLPYTNISSRHSALLLHFSEHIAGEMIAIDGHHNGWRHIVLPAAHTDKLLLTAVLAASSFHVGAKKRASLLSDESITAHDLESHRLYYRAIKELQQRQDLTTCDAHGKASVLLAVLVLLVAVMVTGSDDFPALFGILEKALALMGGEASLGHGELSSFILRQIHKMRFYAAPLLSERTGVAILSSQDQVFRGLACMRFCLEHQPQYSQSVSAIESLVRQSREIYLRQATSLPTAETQQAGRSKSVARIQQFKETLEAFPREGPGSQVLIWATFMAASDCILPEHQAFFTRQLQQYHQRSGFLNLRKGLEHLQSIWRQRRCTGDSWVRLLPRANVFVV